MGFRTLLADPPWNESGAGKIKRGADRHYPVLKTRDIAPTIKESGLFLPAEDAHLWLWVTNNRLPDGLQVISDLGFKYVSNVAWVKTKCVPADGSDPKVQIGLGQYLRGSHELLLFAVRGRGQSEDVWHGKRSVPSVLFAPRTKHSAKPAESYDLIERVSKGPAIEFFARGGRAGWLAWGNEMGSAKNEREENVEE